MSSFETTLDALCIRGLLRCLGSGPRSNYGGPTASLTTADIEPLKMWWALSLPVGALATRCVARPREISSSLEDFRRDSSGEIPGSIDAAASVLLQSVTCDSSAFVVTEASSTWLSGPNRVLTKTLDAARGALRAAALHARTGIFDEMALERLTLIDEALRIGPLREIISSPAGRARIVPYERRQAAKARSPLYRLAWDCASSLAGIEDMNQESIAALLALEVLPKLEVWRRFELACLVEVGEALSGSIGEPCVLDMSFASGRPAARIADIELWWQRSIPSRPEEHLDEGEKLAINLAASLGIAAGTSRADLTIERSGRILGIIECKWFGDRSSTSSAVLDATYQLTNYARNAAYRQGENSEELLSRSLVALASRGNCPLRTTSGPVGCIEMSDLGQTALAPWATSLINA